MKKGQKEENTFLQTDDKRIRAERNRLMKIFKNVDGITTKVNMGLIERAAFMRILLETLENDVNLNGATELFRQGQKQQQYTRTRPAAKMYTQMQVSYQKTIKQLMELLPDCDDEDGVDPLDDF
jgi:hypothetical protein